MSNRIYGKNRRTGILELIRRKWRKDMTFYFHWIKLRKPRAEALDCAERTLA